YTVPAVLSVIEQIADKDPDKLVQAKALEILVELNDKKYEPLFMKYVNDSSYSVSGAALDGITKLEPDQAYNLAKKYSHNAAGKLGEVVARVIMKNPTEDDFDILLENYKSPITSQEEAMAKIRGTATFADYLSKLKNDENVKKGVDEIMAFRNQIPPNYRSYVDPGFKKALNKISDAKRSEGNTQLADYIDGLLK
ncbi:MAG: HEAT repeat domain-containing protein, partial [Ginsengibacter sp.]